MQGSEEDVLFPELDADINHFNELYPDTNTSVCSEYYNVDKFNDIHRTNTDFSLFSYNSRLILRHYDELHTLLSCLSRRFDALSFSETWLNEYTKQLISIDGYTPYHSLRPVDKMAGGLSVFVKNKSSVTIIPNTELCLDYIECISLRS